MNRFGSFFRPLVWFMALPLAAFVAGCGSGGGGGDAAPAAPVIAPIGAIAGNWAIHETAVTASNSKCQPPTDPLKNYTLVVTQSGNDLTVKDSANPTTPTTFTGTINGDAVTWSGSFPEQGGVTTFNSVNVTVAASCNSLSGTSTWTYVQNAPAVFSCTGTTTFTGTEIAPTTGCAL